MDMSLPYHRFGRSKQLTIRFRINAHHKGVFQNGHFSFPERTGKGFSVHNCVDSLNLFGWDSGCLTIETELV